MTSPRNIVVAVLLAALSAAQACLAQQPKAIARIDGFQGNVLMSTSTGLAAANGSSLLTEGMRVITTSNSSATIVFPDTGCTVQLKENQRLELKVVSSCDKIIALVQSLLPAQGVPAAVVTTQVATTGIVSAGELAAFGAVVGLGVLESHRSSRSVSPN
jgi:hypothetical protein